MTAGRHSGYDEGRGQLAAPFILLQLQTLAQCEVVSVVESMWVVSIAIESIAAESGAIVGAGAAAGAAVLSMTGVSSCELQAASVSTTAAARARRFIPISLRGLWFARLSTVWNTSER